MIDKLKEAFNIKEKTEFYLNNLEGLKNDNTIDENHYNALKDEYTKMREDAQAKIFAIKAQYKKMLDVETKKLATAKLDLKYLEIRYKVGQVTTADYTKKIKEPQRKFIELEKKITHFKNIIDSKYAHDIKQPQVFKLFGKNQPYPSLADIPKSDPGKSAPAPTATEVPVEVPAPQPPPPPVQVAPPPPQVTVTTITTENIIESEPPPPPPPPSIVVSSLEILPDRVEQGSQIGIIATIQNPNDSDIHRVLDLKINDEVKDSCTINLNSGESQEVTFIVTGQKAGEYTVALENTIGTFSVIPRMSSRP